MGAGAEKDPAHGEVKITRPSDVFDIVAQRSPLEMIGAKFVDFVRNVTEHRCSLLEPPAKENYGVKPFVFLLDFGDSVSASRVFGELNDEFERSDATVTWLGGTSIVRVSMSERFFDEMFAGVGEAENIQELNTSPDEAITLQAFFEEVVLPRGEEVFSLSVYHERLEIFHLSENGLNVIDRYCKRLGIDYKKELNGGIKVIVSGPSYYKLLGYALGLFDRVETDMNRTRVELEGALLQ